MSPYLVEVVGPAHGQDAVYWRTVVNGVEGQRDASNRLLPLLADGWRLIFRPLGSLDRIEEQLRSRQ